MRRGGIGYGWLGGEYDYVMNETDIESGSIEDFTLRFAELQEQAKAYGFDTIVAMHYQDKFSEDSDSFVNASGNYMACLGLGTQIMRYLHEG